ncbi:probable FBD-associated F-box protein At1g32375 [Brassica rapa]|uniref:F-box domain-containing protein n=1 Tax=Brassica campestris TaxID=3711 RepID=M4F3G6_BRACM|nr:probable FBD-associated F-box protein At1g32375 [Brassica rapa]
MAHRDRISQLPEELLLRILSLLPAKDVAVTMVLSKRWKFLWTLVPTLEYDHATYQNAEGTRFSRFVYSSLLLHEAPVLETLRLKLDRESATAVDIGVWVKTAVKRYVRELDIDINSPSILTPVTLPWSLFAGGCKTLATLKLSNMTLVDASSSLPASFPSLKNLSLVKMKYPSEEFINKLLASCPVLDDLAVELCSGDGVTVLAVQIPSLKSLSLRKRPDTDDDEAYGFVIDTPSLVSFDIVDHCGELCVVESNMPEIVYVNLDINYRRPWKMLSSLSSVKQLELCLTSSKEYPVGIVFHNLAHLMICTCETEWLNLLLCVLKDSPKLQGLRIEQYHNIRTGEQRPCWKEPSSVPGCVLTSLETLEWVKYEGTEDEKEAAAFIFRNARFLKKATISSSSTDPVKKLEMLKGLSFLSRCSSSCHLTFD